jgi:hypothetical protein
VRSYRDTVRLFLEFIAADKGGTITRLGLDDLSFGKADPRVSDDAGKLIRGSPTMSGSAAYTVMQFMSARTGNAPLHPLISSAILSPPVVLPAQPASQSPSR